MVDDEVVVDDEMVTPDASVIEKWEDPVDIGEEYPVGEIKSGDIVHFASGEQYKVGFTWEFKGGNFGDSFFKAEKALLDLDINVYFKRFGADPRFGFMKRLDVIKTLPSGSKTISTDLYVFQRQFLNGEPLGEPRWWRNRTIQRGIVVTEGPPVVCLTEWDDDSAYIDLEVRIDRELDYSLLVYLELQTQDVEDEVRRERVFRLVPKGTSTDEDSEDEFPWIRIGDKGKHVKASVSILPYTEMKKIALPVSIDIGSRNIVVPAGHTFRAYRIESPSYMMYEASDETW